MLSYMLVGRCRQKNTQNTIEKHISSKLMEFGPGTYLESSAMQNSILKLVLKLKMDETEPCS